MTLIEPESCPDCGARLSAERWSSGLCLSCLLDLGLSAPSKAEPRPPVSQPAAVLTVDPLAPGQVLGERYRIRSLLGRGGMGEVFRAFDLKLRVDVALKAVRVALLADERALDGLRQEVRAAREVVSPNVCRVFDLIELDGRELVSMEFVDGVTLADLLRERSPLDLQEARQIASQFLAGLEAIHAAGLVHRDIKPENVMITRAGRVVVMDFGIARAMASVRGGTISGTPAYMALEQARGEGVDARADVFSAGVVLAEMVAASGHGTRRRAKRSGAASTTGRRDWTIRRGPPFSGRRSPTPAINGIRRPRRCRGRSTKSRCAGRATSRSGRIPACRHSRQGMRTTLSAASSRSKRCGRRCGARICSR